MLKKVIQVMFFVCVFMMVLQCKYYLSSSHVKETDPKATELKKQEFTQLLTGLSAKKVSINESIKSDDQLSAYQSIFKDLSSLDLGTALTLQPTNLLEVQNNSASQSVLDFTAPDVVKVNMGVVKNVNDLLIAFAEEDYAAQAITGNYFQNVDSQYQSQIPSELKTTLFPLIYIEGDQTILFKILRLVQSGETLPGLSDFVKSHDFVASEGFRSEIIVDQEAIKAIHLRPSEFADINGPDKLLSKLNDLSLLKIEEPQPSGASTDGSDQSNSTSQQNPVPNGDGLQPVTQPPPDAVNVPVHLEK